MEKKNTLSLQKISITHKHHQICHKIETQPNEKLRIENMMLNAITKVDPDTQTRTKQMKKNDIQIHS